MSNFDSKFESIRQDWETPDKLFDIFQKRFNLNFDLAASGSNTKLHDYFAKEDNSLTKIWKGNCWLNPPYGDKKGNKLSDWVRKAFYESQNKHCSVVMLIPARTNTRWWKDYCSKAKQIFFITGRPKFKGCKYGLPQPLAILFFEHKDIGDSVSERYSYISV